MDFPSSVFLVKMCLVVVVVLEALKWGTPPAETLIPRFYVGIQNSLI